MVALLIQPFISILKLGFSRVLNRVRRNGVKVDEEQKKDDNEEENDEVKDENDTAVQVKKDDDKATPSEDPLQPQELHKKEFILVIEPPSKEEMETFEEELAAKDFSLIPSLLVMPFGEEVPKLIINRVPSNGAKEDEKDGRKETNETAAHMNNEIDVDITGGKKDVCIATSDDNHPERPLRKEDILWHKPPNMDYSRFEVYNDVQK